MNVLNDYYQADLNSYKSGTIKYPFSALSEGKHTLTLKVWDVTFPWKSRELQLSTSGSDAYFVASSKDTLREYVLFSNAFEIGYPTATVICNPVDLCANLLTPEGRV